MDEVTDWRTVGLCAPPADTIPSPDHVARWFPLGYYRGAELVPAAAAAVAICRKCPSQAPCLKWAMDHKEPDGIWGGTTPQERGRKFRRRFAA
jgi:hypothetical protein